MDFPGSRNRFFAVVHHFTLSFSENPKTSIATEYAMTMATFRRLSGAVAARIPLPA